MAKCMFLSSELPDSPTIYPTVCGQEVSLSNTTFALREVDCPKCIDIINQGDAPSDVYIFGTGQLRIPVGSVFYDPAYGEQDWVRGLDNAVCEDSEV